MARYQKTLFIESGGIRTLSVTSKSTPQWGFRVNHRLINYIDSVDTKANCRHLKYLPVKVGLCGRCLSEFIDWRYSQSYWYFRPRFVNCCSPPLLSGLTLPPPPLPSVNKCTVYTYAVCKEGVWNMGYGSHKDKHLPQSPFKGQFFRWRHYALPSMGPIFLRCTRTMYVVPGADQL